MKKTLITLMALASCAMGETTTVTLKDAVYTGAGSSLTSSVDLSSLDAKGSFTLTYTVDVKALFSNTTFMIGADFYSTEKTTFVSLSGVDTGNGNASRTIGTAIGTSSKTIDGKVLVSANGIYQTAAAAGAGVNYTGTTYYGGSTFWNAGNNITEDQISRSTEYLKSLQSITVTQSHTDRTGTIMYLTLIEADGTTRELFMSENNTSLKWSNGSSTFGDWTTLKINTDVVSSVYLFEGTVDAATARTLNEAANLAIPEPATATLSLLALAGLAARRRRH